MRWTSRPMTEADAKAVAAWRYAPPLDVYNDLEEDELSAGGYRAALLDGTLAGFYCVGLAARIPDASDIYAAHPGDVDLGLGLRPDLVGRGLGLSLIEHALDFIGRARPVRLAVLNWNVRARQVYERAGFCAVANSGPFMILRRPAFAWQDATRPLAEGVPTYPDDPPLVRSAFLRAEQGGYDGTHLSMTVHTGTHVDAPLHVALPGGVDDWPLERMMSTVQLLDVREGRGPIPLEALEKATGSRLLLRTLSPDAPDGRGLGLDAASALVDRGLTLLGVDGLSVGPLGPEGLAVHRLLLGEGVLLVENLALEGFEAGWYDMRCLPLRLPDCDGAPARVLLRSL